MVHEKLKKQQSSKIEINKLQVLTSFSVKTTLTASLVGIALAQANLVKYMLPYLCPSNYPILATPLPHGSAKNFYDTGIMMPLRIIH